MSNLGNPPVSGEPLGEACGHVCNLTRVGHYLSETNHEYEARATPPALDVERLTKALDAAGYTLWDNDAGYVIWPYDVEAVAAEYARLSASGESPEPSGEPE